MSENVKNTTHIVELADCWDNAVKVFSEVERLNLDKKQALINIIVNICGTYLIKDKNVSRRSLSP
ncbi:MAG: hypothetical protein ACLU99_07340 [Alphaproteobacteria bacterium]